jgi:phage tail-like protein
MDHRREEPLLGARFRVEIEGVRSTGVTEVIFPEGRIAASHGPARRARSDEQSRAVQYGPLTLRRALIASSDWYRWWDAARGSSKAVKKRVVVAILDGSMREVQLWAFTGTLPVAYVLSPLNAGRGDVLVETLELSVGGFSLTVRD